MLEAYLDDSGTDDQSPVVAVAGWVASSDRWARFNAAWPSFINDNGLTRWKHSQFYAREREYKGWDDIKSNNARQQLCHILGPLELFGVGVAVRRDDYEAARKAGTYKLPENPYAFCVERCLNRLMHGMYENPVDEGILPLGACIIGKGWMQKQPNHLQLASAILIVGVALWMLWRTWQDNQRAKLEGGTHNHHTHDETRMVDTGHGIMKVEIYEKGQHPHWRISFEHAIGTVKT